MDAKFVLKAVDNATRVIKNVEQSVGNLNKKVKTSAQSFSDRGKRNEATFRSMRNTGAVALAGIGTVVFKAREEANKLTESVNAVNVVFGDSADKILEFGENSATSVGLANSQFNQMATETGALLTKTGMSMDQVAGSTINLSKRASDLASVYNTSVSEAMSAINQALRGETEAIRKYAADVTDASVQQYMLANGIEGSVTEMSQQEKIMMRMKVLMSDTNIVANDFQNTINSDANAQRVFNAQMQDGAASLGTSLIPVIQSARNAVSSFLQPIYARIEQNQELTKKIVLVAGAIAGLVTVLGVVGLAIPAITTAITALSGPIGIIILAIGALATAWATNFGGIRDKTKEALESIKKWFNDILKEIGITNKQFRGGVKIAIKVARESIKTIFEFFLVRIFARIKAIFLAIFEFVKSIFTGLGKIIGGIVGLIKAIVTGDFKAMWENVKKIFSGAFDILISPFRAAFVYIKERINGIIEQINVLIRGLNKIGKHAGFTIGELKRLGEATEEAGKSSQKLSSVFGISIDSIKNKVSSGGEKLKEFGGKAMTFMGQAVKAAEEYNKKQTETKYGLDNIATGATGAGNAIKDYSSKVKQSFEELKASADTALAKVTEEFEKQSTDLKKRADEILGSIRSLSQDFNAQTKSDEQGLAKTFVEAKQKQKEMEMQLVNKKKELRSVDDADRRMKLQNEIIELQANIEQQKEVRRNSKDMRVRLADEIAEVERRNDMTKLQREIEDFNKREKMRKEEFKKKAETLVKELLAVQVQQQQIQEKHKYTQAKIQAYIKVSTEEYNKAMQQQKIFTKSAADSMVSDFGRVRNSIEDAISAMQRLNSMGGASYGISGYANGGVVEGGFQAFASGGVVDRPTLGLVGEGRYNEAVVPLPDGNRIPVEMRGGGGAVLNINLNGNFYGSDDEFADRLGDTIIAKFQQADQGNFARF